LAFGGYNGATPGRVGNTESWNGTSWTELNDLNTVRDQLGGDGIQTAALAFGGETPVTGATESWNGSAWTTKNSLNTARTGVAGTGTNTVGLAIGGEDVTPVFIASTEEWSGTPLQTVNITVS
jgi:uncharacterized membrane protein